MPWHTITNNYFWVTISYRLHNYTLKFLWNNKVYELSIKLSLSATNLIGGDELHLKGEEYDKVCKDYADKQKIKASR